MKFENYQEKLEQLKKLLTYSTTGSPKELAKKLNVSERTARRLIERLRMQNYLIRYCRKSNTYVLDN